MRTFIDTNVLVYADDQAAGRKTKRARTVLAELLRSDEAVVSTQVLSEYFVTATRKLGLSIEAARHRVEQLGKIDVVTVSPTHVLSAIDLMRLQKLSYWDALILRCAASASCAVLLSEDLSHGQTLDGVRIENPFR